MSENEKITTLATALAALPGLVLAIYLTTQNLAWLWAVAAVILTYILARTYAEFIDQDMRDDQRGWENYHREEVTELRSIIARSSGGTMATTHPLATANKSTIEQGAWGNMDFLTRRLREAGYGTIADECEAGGPDAVKSWCKRHDLKIDDIWVWVTG